LDDFVEFRIPQNSWIPLWLKNKSILGSIPVLTPVLTC